MCSGRSTLQTGVGDTNPTLKGEELEISKTFRFEASHVLPKHPGKCSRLHGHSWVLTVSVQGPVNPETGFVMDFAELSVEVKNLVADLDHHHLGAWAPAVLPHTSAWSVPWLTKDFYPTSENLLIRIGTRLLQIHQLDWSTLSLEETCTSRATLTREEFNAIKERKVPKDNS